MRKEAVVFEAVRQAYSIKQVADSAVTVGALIEMLEEYDEDTIVVLSHDNGYTFGSINRWDGRLFAEQEDGEWEEM